MLLLLVNNKFITNSSVGWKKAAYARVEIVKCWNYCLSDCLKKKKPNQKETKQNNLYDSQNFKRTVTSNDYDVCQWWNNMYSNWKRENNGTKKNHQRVFHYKLSWSMYEPLIKWNAKNKNDLETGSPSILTCQRL